MGAGTVVLIPIKSFELAKGRLAEIMDFEDRRHLIRNLAEGVVRAARPLPTFVVTDDPEVAGWAVDLGANVIKVTAAGLNPAMEQAREAAGSMGFRRAIISHGDLPMARDLSWLDDGSSHADVVIVPDRHGTGTNVMAVPLAVDEPFRFHYGPGSARAHRLEAERLGLTIAVVNDEALGWDLDTPSDLEAWARNGSTPTGRASSPVAGARDALRGQR